RPAPVQPDPQHLRAQRAVERERVVGRVEQRLALVVEADEQVRPRLLRGRPRSRREGERGHRGRGAEREDGAAAPPPRAAPPGPGPHELAGLPGCGHRHAPWSWATAARYPRDGEPNARTSARAPAGALGVST